MLFPKCFKTHFLLLNSRSHILRGLLQYRSPVRNSQVKVEGPLKYNSRIFSIGTQSENVRVIERFHFEYVQSWLRIIHIFLFFIGFYTILLFPAAVVGVINVIYGLAKLSDYTPTYVM